MAVCDNMQVLPFFPFPTAKPAAICKANTQIGDAVTDRIAVWLGAIVVAALVLDQVANGGGVAFFLIRKFMDLIEYLAIWR